ncbi:hypothetical protein Plhal304r1_c035g0108211 [Plasmopara halstedii]
MLPSALFDQVIRDAERTLLWYTLFYPGQYENIVLSHWSPCFSGNIERSAFSFMSNWEQSHIEKETRRRLPHSPF